MEIIDLKKYLTPFEFQVVDKDIRVKIYSDTTIEASGFYNSIFKGETGSLRKRLFTIIENGKIVSVITSIIPQKFISNPRIDDIEEETDKIQKSTEIYNDIMLTWPSNDEEKLFLSDQTQEKFQVILRKALFVNANNDIIRYEEDAMLPDVFCLQKG